jgi:superfamily II DNA or RNA helicase
MGARTTPKAPTCGRRRLCAHTLTRSMRHAPRLMRASRHVGRPVGDRDHALRPYQTAAVAAVAAHWRVGRRRVLVCLPTGAGKTTVAAAAIAAALPPGSSALAFVHTRTLLQQTRARLGAGGVRVVTIQATLRAGKLPAGCVPAVVFIDEAHHMGSRAWSRLLALLPAGVLVLGCTATPVRADGTAMGRAGAGFDAIVSTAPYSLLRKHGWLAPCDVVRPQSGTDAASAYLAHGAGRPGVLFAPSIARCEAAVRALQARGVRAAAITALTPARARRAAFAAFDRGDLDLLASPMALSEGFDAPRAAVCVLDRTCVHHGVYLQTAGRVLRPHPSKHAGAPALLIDLHGASERHGHPLADRTYHLDGEPIRLEQAPSQRAPRRPHAPHATAARPAAPRRAPPRTAAHRAGQVVGAYMAAAREWLGALWGWAP